MDIYGRGYFISPKGEAVEVVEHIEWVRDNLERVGLSPECMREIEEKYGAKEKGKIRKEVLFRVIKKGWIRIRTCNEMHVEVWVLDDLTKRRIRKFLRGFHDDPDLTMIINELATGKSRRMKVKKFLNPCDYPLPIFGFRIKGTCDGFRFVIG